LWLLGNPRQGSTWQISACPWDAGMTGLLRRSVARRRSPRKNVVCGFSKRAAARWQTDSLSCIHAEYFISIALALGSLPADIPGKDDLHRPGPSRPPGTTLFGWVDSSMECAASKAGTGNFDALGRWQSGLPPSGSSAPWGMFLGQWNGLLVSTVGHTAPES